MALELNLLISWCVFHVKCTKKTKSHLRTQLYIPFARSFHISPKPRRGDAGDATGLRVSTLMCALLIIAGAHSARRRTAFAPRRRRLLLTIKRTCITFQPSIKAGANFNSIIIKLTKLSRAPGPNNRKKRCKLCSPALRAL